MKIIITLILGIGICFSSLAVTKNDVSFDDEPPSKGEFEDVFFDDKLMSKKELEKRKEYAEKEKEATDKLTKELVEELEQDLRRASIQETMFVVVSMLLLIGGFIFFYKRIKKVTNKSLENVNSLVESKLQKGKKKRARSELYELKKLYDSEIISKEEFENKVNELKKEVL